MGKTKIFLLLVGMPIFLLLVTVNLHSQSQLATNKNQAKEIGGSVPDYIKHKVKAGDSLLSLAYTYRTSAEYIKKVNNITRNSIYIGEVLNIPYNSKGYEGENKYIMYKVSSGDSLSELALKYNTDIDSIKRINKLDSNQINNGQRLEIPYGLKNADTEPDYVTTKVSASSNGGDTVYKEPLDNKYNKFMISGSKDRVGQQFQIADRSNINADSDSYTLNEKDDSDYKDLENNLIIGLADRNAPNTYLDAPNTSEENIVTYISDNADSVQQKSVISPDINSIVDKSNTVTDNSRFEYTIRSGDNLSSIAEEYDATAAELKEFNNLRDNILQPGQKIMIPRYDFTRYRIKEGDNLSTIAADNNTCGEQNSAGYHHKHE